MHREDLEELHYITPINNMRPFAIHCTENLLLLCEDCLGKPINSENDLIDGWNMLRDNRGLTGKWVFEGEIIKGVFHECGCPLIRSGLVELHPVQCYCSQNMMERIFSQASKKVVNVKIKRSVGRGDSVCEFIITFEK